MGAAPAVTRASPVTPAMLPAQGGQRDGPGLLEPQGGRFTPPPPPRQASPLAAGRTPTEHVRQGGMRQ